MRRATRCYSLLASSIVLLGGGEALADPPAPPKVCVVVAGDPDPAVRASADRLSTAIASRNELRGVSDDATRAALRGEATTEPALATYGTARRALTGGDQDAAPLQQIAEPLGCALVVEVAARPAATLLRAYDVVHRSFRGTIQVGVVDASLIDRFVLDAARGSNTAASGAPAAVDAPPVGSSAPPAHTEATTAAPLPGSATPPATLVHAGSSAPPGTSIASALPGSAGAPGGSQQSPGRADPRVTVPANNNANRGTGPVPWIVAGAAALAIVGVFIATQSSGPGPTVINVTHPGSGGP